MRAALLSIFLLAAAVAEYELVWSDEFTGDTLNTTNWKYEVDCNGGGNNELQCYTADEKNVFVRDGMLTLKAIPDGLNGKKYTSGRITTQHSAAWKYGRFEIRAQVPDARLLWPALWMMPRDNVYGEWAASGEIDILEFRGGRDNEHESNLHFGGSWPKNKYEGTGIVTRPVNLTLDFHVFSLLWTPDYMTFAIDEKVHWNQTLVRSFNAPEKQSFPYRQLRQPFNERFFFIMNLAVGGNFFGPEIGQSLTTEQAKNWTRPTFQVDYVRVYQDSSVVDPPPPVTASDVQCSTMYADRICRTESQNMLELDVKMVDDTLGLICSKNSSYCNEILNGSFYSSCNNAQRVSMAMDAFYNASGSQPKACFFGGLGFVNGKPAPPPPVATSAECADAFSKLTCRTTSQYDKDVNMDSVNGARNYLCGVHPQHCVSVAVGGYYSNCSAAQQISIAMDSYYKVYAPDPSACDFGGLGKLVPVLPSVNITVRLEGELSTFNSTKFLEVFARILSTDVQRLRINSLRSGSVIVDLSVLPSLADSDKEDPTTLSRRATSSTVKDMMSSSGYNILSYGEAPPSSTVQPTPAPVPTSGKGSDKVALIVGLTVGIVALVVIVIVISLVLVMRTRKTETDVGLSVKT